MDKTNHDKWAEWASRLHGDEANPKNILPENPEEDLEFEFVESIFELREKVGQAKQLTPPDAAWNKFRKKNSPNILWGNFVKYAAIIVLSMLVGGTSFWGINKLNAPTREFATITAPNGQISNITLFDGTNVWLNAGSTLKYKQDFNHKNREVFLDGEAYFNVTKNKEIPFIVNAKQAQVKVLGTIFNLKAFSNQPKIETVLVEGKVQFVADGTETELNPGEHLLFSETTGKTSKKEVNTSEYTSWKGGKIYFNNETLGELALQLERWYEVKFQFSEESIKKYRFTGVINKEKTLDYTLKIIAEINKVDFKIENEQILIINK